MGKEEDPKGIYRSIYSSIWDDPDFLRLTKDEKLIFLNLRTSPLSNMPCVFPYYIDAIEKQTGVSRKGILKAINTLSDTLWITVEDGLCWIRNGLKYDPNISLNNPKHREAIRKIILSLPKFKLVFDFCEYYKIDIPYPIPYQIPYRPAYANQDTDTDTDTEPDTEPEQDSAVESLSPTSLVKVWNQKKPDCLPRVVLPLNPNRNKKALSAIKTRPQKEFWETLIVSMSVTPFLLGANDRGWKADFDFILDKYDKIFEGKYKNQTKVNPKTIQNIQVVNSWRKSKESEMANGE